MSKAYRCDICGGWYEGYPSPTRFKLSFYMQGSRCGMNIEFRVDRMNQATDLCNDCLGHILTKSVEEFVEKGCT